MLTTEPFTFKWENWLIIHNKNFLRTCRVEKMTRSKQQIQDTWQLSLIPSTRGNGGGFSPIQMTRTIYWKAMMSSIKNIKVIWAISAWIRYKIWTNLSKDHQLFAYARNIIHQSDTSAGPSKQHEVVFEFCW